MMEYGIWGFHAAGGLWGDPRLSRRQPILPSGVTPQMFSRATLALSSLYHQDQAGRIGDTDDGPYEAMELTAKSSSTRDEIGNDADSPLDTSKKSQNIETNIERDEDDEHDDQNHVPNEIDNDDLADESDSASSSSSHHSSGNNNLLTDKLDPMACFSFDKDGTVNPMLNGWVLGAYTAMLGRLSAATAALEATEVPSLPSDSDSEMSDQSSYNEKSRDNSPIADTYRGYPCGSCEIVAATRPALKKHILDCHSASSSSLDTGSTGDPRRCPSIDCDFTSTSRCEIETHVAAHVAQEIAPSGKKRTLALQRVRYEREEYRCSLCTYACTIEKAFQRHLRAHARGTAPETRVSCAVCGADRSSEVDLSRHMRRHRDDRYFCCDICVFRTVQLKKLIQHRRMHTGEKPHLCPHCAYRSARRDNLRSHVRRVHKKENLYCDTFSPRGMLITPAETGVDPVPNLVHTPAKSPSSDNNAAD